MSGTNTILGCPSAHGSQLVSGRQHAPGLPRHSGSTARARTAGGLLRKRTDDSR